MLYREIKDARDRTSLPDTNKGTMRNLAHIDALMHAAIERGELLKAIELSKRYTAALEARHFFIEINRTVPDERPAILRRRTTRW